MILIIGGAFQGKAKLAKELAAERRGEKEGERLKILDGNREDLSEGEDASVLLCYHEFIRNYLKLCPEADRQEIRQLAGKTAESFPCACITMDEVGCGVVPMSREERSYREAAGEAGQELARLAEQVIRVTAGIPVRIK